MICQPSDDEAIRHRDSLSNSALEMKYLVSGRKLYRTELPDRPWKGSGEVWVPLTIVL